MISSTFWIVFFLYLDYPDARYYYWTMGLKNRRVTDPPVNGGASARIHPHHHTQTSLIAAD
jgi:hypothetical protein